MFVYKSQLLLEIELNAQNFLDFHDDAVMSEKCILYFT